MSQVDDMTIRQISIHWWDDSPEEEPEKILYKKIYEIDMKEYIESNLAYIIGFQSRDIQEIQILGSCVISRKS